MIVVQDRIIGADVTQIVSNSLNASAARKKGDRPADVVLMFEGGEASEPSFAGLRFDEESKQLMPFVEVGRWGNLVLVMGLRKWLIFEASPLTPLGNLDLYREQNDDTGFYRVSFHVHNSLLIAIYEGGVAAISAKGDIRWHRRKHWDDEMLEVNNNRLILLAETGERFAFNCSDGRDVATD